MKKSIGILGGGQLARMLCLRGSEMGYEMHVLSASASDPAAQVTGFWQKGDVNKLNTLKSFLKKVDVATFESEFLNAELLEKAHVSTGTPIWPKPSQMGLLQDRLSQKKLLEKYEIETSPFLAISNYIDLKEAYIELSKDFDNFEGLVLKQRKFGYDGYGTFILKTLKDVEKTKPIFKKVKDGFIAELFVGFDRELAITVCRNRKKEFRFLPLVESCQENARCLWVKGPVEHPELYTLNKKIKNFLNKINYIGIISFELFETEQGLIINEIAPRVHNSAHYSQDALFTDQFSYCIQAINNETLPPVEPISDGFAMYNLLGSSSKKPRLKLNPLVKLHWYGKADNRKGRKMGHINAVEDNADLALRLLRKSLGDFNL